LDELSRATPPSPSTASEAVEGVALAPMPSEWELFAHHFDIEPEAIDYDSPKWDGFLAGVKAARAYTASEAPAREAKQSIEEDIRFQCILYHYVAARMKLANGSLTEDEATDAFRALIAYIDGRTAGAAPEGYVLVPEVPTDDMIVAFAEQWYSKVRCIDDCEMEDCYAAMIAAAPSPTNTGTEEDK
jgi:hypothetical protein